MHTLKDSKAFVIDEAHFVENVSHMSCWHVHGYYHRICIAMHCRDYTFQFVLKRIGEVRSLILSEEEGLISH